MRRLWARLIRGAQVAQAFVYMGYRSAVAYPANLVSSQTEPLIQIVLFYFVSKLVGDSASGVGDYFTYVVVGWTAIQLMQAGLGAFSFELMLAVNQGRFEMLLVEPIRWSMLPFGLALWPLVWQFVTVVTITAAALLLGARFEISGVLPAMGLLLLGVVATISVGTLSGGVVVLAKRGNPFIKIYMFAATIFSGALFPIDLLPTWLRPLSYVVPHTYVIGGIRSLLMPGAASMPHTSFTGAAISLLIFIAVVLPIAIWVFGAAMSVGRRHGTLSGY